MDKLPSLITKVQNQLHELDQSLLLSGYQKQLTRLKEHSEKRQLKVGVIGEFKAGKSTLLNALLAQGVKQELLPTGNAEKNALPIHISYGKNLEFSALSQTGSEVKYKDAKKWQKDGSLAGPRSEKHPSYKKYQKLILRCPHPLLRRNVHFFDTPGLGSSSLEMQALTRQFVREVDVAIYVVRMGNQPFNKRESELIRQFLEGQDFSKMIFVVNGIDEIIDNRDANLEEECERLRQIIVALTGMDYPHVCFISAEAALSQALDKSDDLQDDKSNFPDFLQLLDRLIFNQAETLLIQSLTQKLLTILESVCFDLELRINASKLGLEEANLEIRNLETRVKSRKKFVSELCESTEKLIATFEINLKKYLEELKDLSVHTCVTKKDSLLPDEVRDIQPEEIQKWIEIELQSWLEKVREKWTQFDEMLQSKIVASLTQMEEDLTQSMLPIITPETPELDLKTKAIIRKKEEERIEYEPLVDPHDNRINIEGVATGLAGGLATLGAVSMATGVLALVPALAVWGAASLFTGWFGNEAAKTIQRKHVKKEVSLSVSFEAIFSERKKAFLKKYELYLKEHRINRVKWLSNTMEGKLDEWRNRVKFLKVSGRGIQKEESCFKQLVGIKEELLQ